MNKFLGFFMIFMIISDLLFAQPAEMADGLRADGKIWIVVAIFGMVMTGMFVYLFKLDRKIKDLEK